MVERTRLETLRSYTELDATFKRRTGLPGFDFARADERAAMGHLLYLIFERNPLSPNGGFRHWSPTWAPTTQALIPTRWLRN